MDRRQKLEELLDIVRRLGECDPHDYSDLGKACGGDVRLTLTTPSGENVSVSVTDSATINQGWAARATELQNLDSLTRILRHRPDMRLAFVDAVSAIHHEVEGLLNAAYQVGRAPNMEAKGTRKLHDRYKHDPLYQAELHRQQQIEILMQQRVALSVELGLCDRLRSKRDFKGLPSIADITNAFEAESPAAKGPSGVEPN